MILFVPFGKFVSIRDKFYVENNWTKYEIDS